MPNTPNNKISADNRRINGIIRRQCTQFYVLVAIASAACAFTAASRALPPASPTATKIAPNFSLEDTDHKLRRLTEFRGRPVVIYFFCGCPWCRNCATQWGLLQRSGATLTPGKSAAQAPNSAAAITLVVFSGDASEARAFAAQTGLNAKQTVLLPDPRMQVTETLYHAEPCPRTFVLNGRGAMIYTNNHADDAARTAPALVITSRVLDALRHSASNTDRSRQHKNKKQER